MTERETLLAEIAEKQARLAELDAEPDYEAWRPALQAYYMRDGKKDLACYPLDEFDKTTIRGLIAAFAKAPPMGSVMGEVRVTEEQSASLHKAMVASFDDVDVPMIPPMGEGEIVEAVAQVLMCNQIEHLSPCEVGVLVVRRIKDYLTEEQL